MFVLSSKLSLVRTLACRMYPISLILFASAVGLIFISSTGQGRRPPASWFLHHVSRQRFFARVISLPSRALFREMSHFFSRPMAGAVKGPQLIFVSTPELFFYLPQRLQAAAASRSLL